MTGGCDRVRWRRFALGMKGTPGMQAVEVLRNQLTQAHDLLEFAIDGLNQEQLHHTFGGSTIQAPGPIYFHVVSGEDYFIQSKLGGREPLYTADGWQAKLGIDPGQGFLSPEWAASVRIVDLPALREYARSVYAATDAYMASITDDDLDGTVDFMGEMRIGDFLGRILVWHAVAHGGELAALKGMHGLKGMPW